MKKIMLAFSAAMTCSAVLAVAEQEKDGIRLLGERLTLRPYVSLYYTYDSNIDSTKHSKSGSSWTVRPGLNADYADDRWDINGGIDYSYHAYNNYSRTLNRSSLREQLMIGWKNSAANERGWTARIGQHYALISQDDDMSNSNGRGVGRDRTEWGFNALVERRVNQHLHAALTAGYYYLKYDNDSNKYAPMYGWRRVDGGGQIGWAIGDYTDFFLDAKYHEDWQDNKKNKRRGVTEDPKRSNISSKSKGYSLHAGIGTRATEKIQYRLSGGWSHYEYGGGARKSNRFTYNVSGTWRVNNTTAVSLMGSSYYQPSERDYGASLMTYNASLGISKLIIPNKLTLTLDTSYRYETHDYVQYAGDDYDTHIMTYRGRVVYRINKWVSAFVSAEYQAERAKGGDVSGHYYDYDRIRGIFGMSLTY